MGGGREKWVLLLNHNRSIAPSKTTITTKSRTVMRVFSPSTTMRL
jgi:hypothetical protein